MRQAALQSPLAQNAYKFIAYQTLWFSCALAFTQALWIGVAVMAGHYLLHLSILREWLWMPVLAGVGIAMEYGYVSLGLVAFKASSSVPPSEWLLWGYFALCLPMINRVLSPLPRWAIWPFCGISGVVVYFSAYRLGGLVSLPQTIAEWSLVLLGWAIVVGSQLTLVNYLMRRADS
ncbi:MAG: DUF2878 family protein [Gammaproteobacteria bacterium]|nr:DUF2878 family protein [Gammaproteobacteria bacterium]